MMANGSDSIQFIKGVGQKRAELLKKLGITSVDALLHFAPRRYLDMTVFAPIGDPISDEPVCIKATVISPVKEIHFAKKNISVFRFTVKDDSGEAVITLYNMRYLAQTIKPQQTYLFYGRLTGNLIERAMTAPIIKRPEQAGIWPVYPLTPGITSYQISRIIAEALRASLPVDPLPEEIQKQYGLCSLKDGLYALHFPKTPKDIAMAHRRFVTEELLTFRLACAVLRHRVITIQAPIVTLDHTEAFFDSMPFTPTDAQRRVVRECMADLQSGQPMHRLVQGDVGSGKTAVAAALCDSVIRSGFQAAVMAPTEILAAQHEATFRSFFEGTGITCALLTGSTPAAQKRAIKADLAAGRIQLVIGTHALLTKDVTFANLGLVITDEQHRFGVAQRAGLSAKGTATHRLVMSATPIPRTLAMIIYGELDISLLDERPKNRQPVKTYCVTPAYHERLWRYIAKQLDDGRQAYLVCPLVGSAESDETDTPSEETGGLLSSEELYEQLRTGPFNNYRIGLLHGRLKSAEKDRIMQEFSSGALDLLVCTTVIEVGVDVPNATILVVENAERFGLSQLHQLRGRIGRGSHESMCVLVSKKQDNDRLQCLCRTNDGFAIADEDLRLRGPGDFIGHRQHGLPLFRLADLSRDMALFRLAGQIADTLMQDDPSLDKPDHHLLKQQVERQLKQSDL